MNYLFEHTDKDGDLVELRPDPKLSNTLFLGAEDGVYLDRPTALKLAAALTEWAEAPEPIKVGDKVVGRITGDQYKVLAIDGPDAFVRRTSDGHAMTVLVKNLEPTDD